MADPPNSRETRAHLFTSATAAQSAPVQTTFTTAGTVYDPTANLPIQPPIRKGRSVRWPPQSQDSIPKILRSLPLDAAIPQSPPTTASSLQRYSPLQQNTYKAATPKPPESDQSSDFGSILRSTAMSGAGNHPPAGIRPPPGFNIASAPSYQQDQDPGAIGDDRDETAAQHRNLITKFNTKTLTNLASYPNPMQQYAQEALDAARPSSTIGSSHSLHGIDTSEKDVSSAIKTLTNLASYPNPMQQHAQKALDAAKGLTDSATDSSGSARPSTTATATMGAHVRPVPTAPRADLDSRLQGPANAGPSSGRNHFTMLSTGPGAPQPLTAGPPGQRQYKASAVEPHTTYDGFGPDDGTSAGVSRGLNPLRPTFTPAAQQIQPDPIGTASHAADNRAPRATLPQHFEANRPAVEHPDSATSCLMSVLREGCDLEPPHKSLPTNYRSIHEIRDTLPMEAVREYYPTGYSNDYSRRPKDSEQMWFGATDPISRNEFEKTEKQMAFENAEMEEAFYAGTHEFGRSARHHARQADRRRLDQKLGMTTRPTNQTVGYPPSAEKLGKPNFQQISVQEARHAPTSHDADVLLNLSFKSMLDFAEKEGAKGNPDPFARRPRSTATASDSDDSHRSFWREPSKETPAKPTLGMGLSDFTARREGTVRSMASGGGKPGYSDFGRSGGFGNFAANTAASVRGGEGGGSLAARLGRTSPEASRTGRSDHGLSAFANPYQGTSGKRPSRTD